MVHVDRNLYIYSLSGKSTTKNKKQNKTINIFPKTANLNTMAHLYKSAQVKEYLSLENTFKRLSMIKHSIQNKSMYYMNKSVIQKIRLGKFSSPTLTSFRAKNKGKVDSVASQETRDEDFSLPETLPEGVNSTRVQFDELFSSQKTKNSQKLKKSISKAHKHQTTRYGLLKAKQRVSQARKTQAMLNKLVF